MHSWEAKWKSKNVHKKVHPKMSIWMSGFGRVFARSWCEPVQLAYNLLTRFSRLIFGCFVHFSAAFQGFLFISFCREIINALYTCRFLGCMAIHSITYEVVDISGCLFSSYVTCNLLQMTSYAADFSSIGVLYGITDLTHLISQLNHLFKTITNKQ